MKNSLGKPLDIYFVIVYINPIASNNAGDLIQRRFKMAKKNYTVAEGGAPSEIVGLIEKVAAAATFGKVDRADCRAVVLAFEAISRRDVRTKTYDSIWNLWVGVQNAAEAGDLKTVAKAMRQVYWLAAK